MDGARWTLIAGLGLACATTTTTKSDTDSTATPTDSAVETLSCSAKADAPACNACIEKSCCAQFAAYDSDPGDAAAVDALTECLYERCPYTCTWEICDSGALYPDLAIAECMGSTCCETSRSCVNDPNCWSCITTEDAAGCAAGELDDAFQACLSACGGV
jgi:hypothetical protein